MIFPGSCATMPSMTGKLSRTPFYHLLPLLAGTCWGLAGVFVRELTKAGLDNPTIVFTRTAAGTILTLVWILCADVRMGRRRMREPSGHSRGTPSQRRAEALSFQRDRSLLYMRPADIPIVLASAAAGSLLLMPCYNIAVNELSLALASILLATAPIFVLLIGALLFYEKITKKKLLCMFFVLLGCVMLSGLFDGGLTGTASSAGGASGASAGGAFSWSPFGFLMGILSAVFNAAFILLSKVIATKGYNSFTITFWSYLFATIVLAFFCDWTALTAYVAAAPAGHLLFLFIQSVCTSLIPSITYIVAMRHVEAGRVAILESGSEPTAAFLAGILLYAEIPAPAGLIGMILTVIALMVLTGDRS